ncbi:unnamed protein product [Urochloa decumbens]|uniref:F-box domain-containing protein n=1 Tax=Urochloa decumbens TaxID=240449 RepID=A0ABC9BVL1_9POAL
MAPPPPPPMMPALVDDVIEEVLTRIPPDDLARLVRASCLCKAWRRVACDSLFRARFPELLGPAPPLLGVICNLGVGGAARFVPTSPFRLSRPDLTGWLALDARHGRVLLASLAQGRVPVPGRVVVWDPVAAERVDLPPLPRHLELQASPWSSWNAAVLCATARDHLDCRRGPFLAALVAVNADSVFALLYSSAAAGWSPPTYLFEPVDLDCSARSVLVDNAVYFMLQRGAGILEYDLSSRELAVIHLPLHDEYGRRIALMTVEGGNGLGFAVVQSSRLHLWSRVSGPDGGPGWTRTRVIELNTLLPAAALTITPYLVGFDNGSGICFLRMFNGMLFSVDLKSGQVKKVHENHGCAISSVVPYTSFCTPGVQH